MHRRMEETAALETVEISNPMFGGDEFDDDLSAVNAMSDTLSRSFTLDVIEKVSSIASYLMQPFYVCFLCY